MKWKPGDRVQRPIFLDGCTWLTWLREGDECLPHSPMRRGVVVHAGMGKDRDLVVVQWDGEIGTRVYFENGIRDIPAQAKGKENGK